MSQVELRKIVSTLGGRSILCELDFRLSDLLGDEPSNPYVVLLGASGCGKTTTLRIIAGLHRPDQGEVWINGRNVDRTPARDRDVAMVFQQDSLYPHLKIAQTLAISARRQPDRRRREEIIQRAIELAGIRSIVDRFPDRLSGGELRRASVAKAIARGASVRLFDEPLAALDAPVRHELARDLRRWHENEPGITIHVTHDGDEAMRIADLIAVMDQGKIIQVASPSEIYERPNSIAVAKAIGSPPMNWIEAVLDIDQRRVLLAFRPDRVRVVSEDNSSRNFSLWLTIDEHHISWRQVNESIHVWAMSGDHELTAVLTRETFTPDGLRWFSVARDDVHCFDARTSQRIEIPEGRSWTI